MAKYIASGRGVGLELLHGKKVLKNMPSFWEQKPSPGILS
jgi:hypothetical protein